MEQLSSGILGSVITLLLVGLVFVAKHFINRSIQYQVKHTYDQKLSDTEHQRDIRLKAELIADLFAEWLSKSPDYQKLNELSFKAFLWLPDELASDLSASLNHQRNAPDVRELISKVRCHLLGQTELESYKVIIFQDPSKRKIGTDHN